jgi:hypothetical protein
MLRGHDVFAQVVVNVLVLAAGLAGAACGTADDDRAGETGRFQIAVQGLAAGSATTELEVPPGSYQLAATGQVSGGTASIDVSAVDAAGRERGRAQVVVPAAAAGAGAEDGDTGSGSVTANVAANGSTSVAIPFRWRGRGPDSGLDTTLQFSKAPTIEYYSVTPAPLVEPAEPLGVEVRATNHTGPREEISVAVTLDLATAALSYDPASGTHKGTLLSPASPGGYTLMVTASDARGGTTSASKSIEVASTLGVATLDCGSANVRVYFNMRSVAQTVHMQGTDNCPDRGSSFATFNADDVEQNRVGVPEGGSIAASVDVPARGYIAFTCAGTGGVGCTYEISF